MERVDSRLSKLSHEAHVSADDDRLTIFVLIK